MAPGLNDEANNAPVSFPSGDTSVAAITSAIEKVLELEAALFRSCSMSVQVFARSVAADKPGSAKTRPSSDIVGRSVVKFIPKVLEVEADGPAVCSDPFVKPSSNPSSNAAINKYSSPLDVQREIAHGARQRLMNSAVAGIALVLVAPGGQLYVTTEEHNAKQVALGLGQCRGCGAFFSHPRARGLKTHQLLSNTKSSTGQCIAAGLAREEREAQFAEEEREAQRQGSGTATSESQAPNFDNICIAGSNADRKKGPDDNSKGSEDESGLLRRLAISSKHQAPWREAQRNSQLAQPPPLPHSPLESGDKSDKTCANSSSTTAAALSTSEHLSPGLAAARDGALATLLELAQGPGGISTVAALVDKHGCGPLMWAAGSGHLACVQWLVRICGCDPATPAKRNGRLPLHWASRNGHLEVIQWLVKGDQYYHREVAAVEEAGSEIKSEDEAAAATAAEETPAINSLYQGMSPETPTFDGDTAFMLAAWQGHLHVCQWLVAKCGSNSTVAHAVNRWGCNAAFKVLLERGYRSYFHNLRILYVLRGPFQLHFMIL